MWGSGLEQSESSSISKKTAPGMCFATVARTRINRRRDTDRRERGIKDYDAWIAQTVG